MRNKFSVLVLLITIVFPFLGSAQYTVESLPTPKVKGQEYFVSNPDGILSDYTVGQLDILSQQVDNSTKAEYAIVVVNDYTGDSDFEFALALFNKWGIGKEASNNGLLLFIAKDRNEYRFISGYGMESIFPDAYLKRVGEKYLVPNFRNGDFDKGILEASTFIAKILESPDSVKELERLMPEATSFWSLKNPTTLNSIWILIVCTLFYLYVHYIASRILKKQAKKPRLFAPIFQGIGCMLILMFFTLFIFAFLLRNLEEVYQVKNLPYFIFLICSMILAMKITDGRGRIKSNFQDAEERSNAYKEYMKWLFVPMLITPLAWVDFFMISKALARDKDRFAPPDLSGDWTRIVRSSNKADKGLLSQGERNEEKLESRKYEIWQNKQNGVIKTIPWEISHRYQSCPKCNFYTLDTSEVRTIRAATYSSSGEGERFDKCHNCSYMENKGRYTIPKKVRSSSSSSSGGGSSSGGRSSSSSSGSFGGGRSGGGGAGGKW